MSRVSKPGKYRGILGNRKYCGARSRKSWRWGGWLESNLTFVQGDLLSEPASGEARAAAWGQLGIRKPQKDEHRAGGSGAIDKPLSRFKV